MRNSTKWLVAAFAVTCSFTVNAFWSIKYDFHEEITRKGLENVSYRVSESEVLRFTDLQIRGVELYNEAFDVWPSYANEARLHFDDEFLYQSYDYIIRGRDKILSVELEASDPWKNTLVIQKKLGNILHTLQDFYSHSTWVEQGRREIVDFYSPSASEYFPRRNDDEDAIGVVCEFEKPYQVIQSPPLSTGYYHQIPPLPESAIKCIHGAVGDLGEVVTTVTGVGAIEDNMLDYCRNGGREAGNSPPGINKDDIECGDGSENDIYALAALLAQQETRVFVQSIVDDLAADRNIKGICALMGYSETDCPDIPELEEPTTPVTNNSGGCSALVDIVGSLNYAPLYYCDFCDSSLSADSSATFDLLYEFGADGGGQVRAFGFSPNEFTWSCDEEDIVMSAPGIFDTYFRNLDVQSSSQMTGDLILGGDSFPMQCGLRGACQ